MSKTIRKSKSVYRWPRLFNTKMEADKARRELLTLDLEPPNRLTRRANTRIERVSSCSAYKQYVDKEKNKDDYMSLDHSRIAY